MYVQTCTIHDISFAVGMLGGYQSNPEIDHWKAKKKVLQYLQGTKKYMLTYRRSIYFLLLGWAYGFPIIVEVGSNLVLNWLLNVELRPNELQMLFQNIDCRSHSGCILSYGKAEQKGNEMAFALAVAGVRRAETFKAWW